MDSEAITKNKLMAMEEIKKAAWAYYTRAPSEEKRTMIDCFCTADDDNNRKVSMSEFLKVIGDEEEHRKAFKLFDINGDGSLDFQEFISMFYISEAKLRTCDGCEAFLPGVYFTCVQCELAGGNPFDLCSVCYSGKGKFDVGRHEHQSFCDNHSLSKVYRELILKQHPTVSKGSSSAKFEQKERGLSTLSAGKKAVEAINEVTQLVCDNLDTVITVGDVAATVCSIM